MSDTREKLAALEHDQWAHWTRYMLTELGILTGRTINARPSIDASTVSRWLRQIETPYAELSETEKDSDRVWANKVLEVMRPMIAAPTTQGLTAGPVVFTLRLEVLTMDRGKAAYEAHVRWLAYNCAQHEDPTRLYPGTTIQWSAGMYLATSPAWAELSDDDRARWDYIVGRVVAGIQDDYPQVGQ